jgi:hypothetical protein
MAQLAICKKRRYFLNWHDWKICITYEYQADRPRNWTGSSFRRGAPRDIIRLKITSGPHAHTPIPIDKWRIISIASTAVRQQGGPVAIIRKRLDDEARSPAWQKTDNRERQMSLF